MHLNLLILGQAAIFFSRPNTSITHNEISPSQSVFFCGGPGGGGGGGVKGSITLQPGHDWLYIGGIRVKQWPSKSQNAILHRCIHGEAVLLVAEPASSPKCPADRPHRSF